LTAPGSAIAADAPSSAAVIQASAAGGLNATRLTFIGTPGTITLSRTAKTAAASLPPSARIEAIAGFTYGSDSLTLNLSNLSGA
jgi:hypothetical protein